VDAGVTLISIPHEDVTPRIHNLSGQMELEGVVLLWYTRC